MKLITTLICLALCSAAHAQVANVPGVGTFPASYMGLLECRYKASKDIPYTTQKEWDARVEPCFTLAKNRTQAAQWRALLRPHSTDQPEIIVHVDQQNRRCGPFCGAGATTLHNHK